jgi:transposase-like protein/IS1 family transposase
LLLDIDIYKIYNKWRNENPACAETRAGRTNTQANLNAVQATAFYHGSPQSKGGTVVNCPNCDSDHVKKCGKGRKGQQRFQCLECGKKFAESGPIGHCRIALKDAANALRMLLEGMSIRATSRLTGIDKDTIQRLMEQAGRQAFQFLANTMQNVMATEIQVDEVWSFVGCKEKTAFLQSAGDGCGDAYAFTAIDMETKLLFCFHVGRRTGEDAALFADKLALCCSDSIRPHVSTDGYNPYHTAIPSAFGHNVDHAMLIKQYASPTGKGQQRYSPASIIGVKEYQNAGMSQPGQACTSHIERSNLTVRMQNRRWTRLTNAFSKKWENHVLMFALFVAWYNFCRPHMTLRTTPAVAAGMASEPWSMERLLGESAKSIVA